MRPNLRAKLLAAQAAPEELPSWQEAEARRSGAEGWLQDLEDLEVKPDNPEYLKAGKHYNAVCEAIDAAYERYASKEDR